MAMTERDEKRAAGIMIGRRDDSIHSIRFPSTDTELEKAMRKSVPQAKRRNTA